MIYKSSLLEELRQDLALMKDWKPASRYGGNTEAEFWIFKNREKPKRKDPERSDQKVR